MKFIRDSQCLKSFQPFSFQASDGNVYSVYNTVDKLDQTTFEVTTIVDDVPVGLRTAERCAAMDFNGDPGKIEIIQIVPLGMTVRDQCKERSKEQERLL